MKFYVLNTKTQRYTLCDSAEAALEKAKDMLLEHSARNDIEVLSVEDKGIANIEQFAMQMDAELPEENTPFHESPDNCYVALNIVTQIAESNGYASNLGYTFPVTAEEFERIKSSSRAMERFVVSKIKETIQSAKYWPEVVLSCYDFNWGDAFCSDIVDAALRTIPEEEVPSAIQSGENGQYMLHTIVVNHDSILLPYDVPVHWVGYKNGVKIVDVATYLDMTSGQVDDSNITNDDLAKIDSAAVFFKDGSSVDCNAEEEWLKLSESSDAVHTV